MEYSGFNFLLALAFAVIVVFLIVAQQTPPPPRIAQQRVLLTIGGAVARHSRGAVGASNDALFRQMRISFARADQYDETMLRELAPPPPPAAVAGIVYIGPLLADVLSASRASGNLIHAYGFSSNFPLNQAQMQADQWRIVFQSGAQPLPVGGQGPLMLMHDDLTRQNEWLPGLFYIEVK